MYYVGIFTSFFPASLILIFYRFLAFFIGQYHLDTPSMIIFTICFGGSAFIMVSELLLCTMLSQKLLDEIKLLVDMLQEIPIKVRFIISLVPKRPIFPTYLQDNYISFIEGEEHTAMYVRDMLVKKLEVFEGLDAGGFMKLNKSLLAGITANFTTYLIVLVQFKMTEKST